jgi:hypothetical protein
MISNLRSMLGKLGNLVSRYPKDPGVRPAAFSDLKLEREDHLEASSGTLAIQSVSDKFYFLLFGAFRARFLDRMHGRADLVVVRSVSGAVGTGWQAEVKRAAPIAWLWTGPWIRAYGALIDGVAYRCATWRHPIRDGVDWVSSKALWQQLQQQQASFTLQIHGIEVADLIIDSYLRFKPSPEFDPSDPFVRRLIWQALRDIRQAEAYFGSVKPRWYLTSYTTYLEHGIPARVAVRHGVNVWSFGSLNKFAKKLTPADTFHTPDFSRYRADFDALDHHDERLEEARKNLDYRLSGGIDAATSYMRQSAYGQASTAVADDVAGSVIIFLHDFYDSPHVYPDMVFHDFWSWVCFTIDTLTDLGITFFVKPHPNQIALSDAALGRLQLKYPDLKLLPAKVSNVDLANAGIACGITVYGTVAHELAYLGIPTISSARHPHHSFDFSRTAKTRDDYVDLLKTYQTLPVPKHHMQRQALMFYYMHNLFVDADQQALRTAFVAFWKDCNGGSATQEAVLSRFHDLVHLPAFERFIDEMVHD